MITILIRIKYFIHIFYNADTHTPALGKTLYCRCHEPRITLKLTRDINVGHTNIFPVLEVEPGIYAWQAW